jgi:hypothetical protein
LKKKDEGTSQTHNHGFNGCQTVNGCSVDPEEKEEPSSDLHGKEDGNNDDHEDTVSEYYNEPDDLPWDTEDVNWDHDYIPECIEYPEKLNHTPDDHNNWRFRSLDGLFTKNSYLSEFPADPTHSPRKILQYYYY